jgi:hypothetical protein
MPKSSPENKAELISRRANMHINSVLSNEWTDKTMTEWQKLRALCLKKPTMSKKDIENDFIASQLYIELPCKSNVLYYNQENDFGQIKVSFTPTTYAKSEVSAIASRLDRILSYGNLRQTFENDGLATNFLPNDYILCPPIWNNIYKGALGEYVGWHLFNSVLGVELSEIVETEIFELFDYAVPDSNIYVDFKHWQDSTKFNEDIMIEKICQKAKLCASKCVIIANILSDNYFNPTVKNIDGVKIIECPTLLKPIEGTEILELNEKSWEIIRRALYEYGNQDQQA